MSPRLIGALCAIGAAVLYGTSWVATGVALHGFSPLTSALLRGTLTALLLLPVVVLGSRSATVGRARGDADADGTPVPPLKSRMLRYLILGCLGGVGFITGMTISIALSGATVAAFIAGAYPVVAAALAPLVLRERPQVLAIAGLVLCFVGAMLVADVSLGGVRVEGAAVAGATALGMGFFLLLSRKWSRQWHLRSTTMTFTNFALVGAGGTALAVALGTPLVPGEATAEEWLAIVWLAAGAGLAGTVLLLESVRRLPAAESAAYLMLNPLTAALLAGPVLGETLAPVQVVGALLVLAGILLANAIAPRIQARRLPAEPNLTSGTP
jgi:probable blue pigment (indigoidine) exporter